METSRIAWLFLLAISSGSACQHLPGEGSSGGGGLSLDLTQLPRGARLVWLGDSLTWQEGYSDLVEQYVGSHHPDRRLRFENLARRGDTAGDLLERFEQEVVPLSPDVVLILVGMNDAGHLGLQRGLLRSYLTRMGELEALVKRTTRARLVWITPTCVLPGSYNRDQKNRMLAAMAAGLVDLGRERKVAVARLHAPFCRALAGEDGSGLMADEEHPSRRGHALIASFLVEWIDPDFRKDL